ncbi:MAG: PLP-dependent aminotransferase family protein [Desulfovibrionaceae bacterium]|nr:PLP-dependent aminotransferase family protein [Desulfovibrionaceae bacterium]
MRLEELKSLYEEHLRSSHVSTRWFALSQALGDMLERGLVEPGERLPTHRELAQALGVTVGTVSRAYADTSQRDLTIGIVGRGTFAARNVPDVDVFAQPAMLRSGCEAAASAGSALFSAEHPLDMGFITPFEHLNPPLEEAVRRLAERPGLNELGGYQAPHGLSRHREAGAMWAARFGLPVAPDNVLVCAGAQHALLTVLASLFTPGDRIAAEQLSYPLLKQLCQRLRLQITPIHMDKHGILPQALEAACRSKAVRGLYLMPTCHNPTLTMIPEFRRREIVDICRRYDVQIIEDDVYALSLEQRLTPLTRLAPERSCFIASTSEALGAGLRIAYLCAPAAWHPALEHTISYTVSMAPPLMAELAALWIGDGTADSVLAAKRRAATEANIMAREKLDGFSLETRTTGFFCWLKLNSAQGAAADFARKAREKGIIVADAACFSAGGLVPEEGVRLALGLRDQAVLSAALETLVRLLQRG